MAINGQIVDEINGLIASRDSIRTTMKAAGIASDTSKLADLATNLAAAKLGATTYNIEASGSITIPAGKLTTGNQTITAKSLASQTTGTAAAGDILSGKIAWVDGAKVTGNIPTVTPTTDTLDCGKSASISKGYLASDVTITANSLASQTPGNAAAADIRLNKTAWAGGTKVTGTMPDGTYSASVSVTNGSASMSATGVSTTTSSNCYVTLSTAAGSAKGTATIGTGGYIAAGSKESSSTSVNVSGNGTKLYLMTYDPTPITVTNSSQTLLTNARVCTGNITIPAVNYYYTSLEGPSDSEGNNGDVWLVVNP